ncbi:alanine--glyoxylate aminotransferase family protein [Catenovulum sp. 2E275]|uniref:pyridoxal-phosphate-dependent aminotransferase family protein n=1 Tax=Catenovulum sp. 2E275 TaxID=2980497 RepID=UPI0021D3E29A|nr:alanine--glyoxylate aminotransferase family protein [Catenovulum sp. 2E275]MCU4674259.1 alanine--glyoxylate aminotransferase family protein [Catenovulum sp. 2E275]
MLIDVPELISLDEILPTEPLLMMGAGPVPIPEQVARANSIVINHLGDTMAKIIDQVKQMSRYVFQTQSKWIMGVAGPGSAAMEMAVTNLVWQDTRVLSICNGFFSSRLAEMASRVGAHVETLKVADASIPDLVEVKQVIERFRPQVITLVQGETSNTVCNKNLAEISQLAHQYGCYVIVDAVCTLSTMPLKMDEWQIDAVITGGQKGLSSIPGVSLIAFSERAYQRIHSRPTKSAQWCLDAQLAEQFWHRSSYHYTAPVSGILAIHEALALICKETLESRFARHLRCSLALQRGIEALGLSLYVPEEARLNSVIGISMPNGIAQKALCQHISNRYRVEIAGSFGLDIVRIGQMGEQSRAHHLFRTLHAFGCSIRDLGGKIDLPTGMAELERGLQANA